MSITIKKINKGTKGFTLIETLVYIAGLVILISVITALIYYVYGWYKNATVVPRTDRVGIAVMDVMLREIWKGESVSDMNNIVLTNGRVILQDSGTYLTPSDINVSRLYLKSITTPESVGVRIEMDITYSIDNVTSTRTYRSMGIMRNSYE